MDDAALWAARARAEGALALAPGAAAPDGFRRLVELGDGSVAGAWLVPVGPDGVTPAALRDLRLGLPALDHRNEASRVLAVCLRCCWTDLAGEPWPGRETSVAAVLGMLADLLPTRLPQTHHRFAVEAFRQLHDSGWLRWRERAGTIRLGPRVAGWPVSELEALRELCRTMPAPIPASGSSPEARHEDSAARAVVPGAASGEETGTTGEGAE
ncbi:hypothetical protein [Cryptosporangium japonicum]|uniref:Uncharacterized protein n=1 Tax=Cryptosporangium japonicum TaxID=80872 RepID=A0ABP3EIU8_9ACTN